MAKATTKRPLQMFWKDRPVILLTPKPDPRGYVCIQMPDGDYANIHQSALSPTQGREYSAWWNGNHYHIREDRGINGKAVDCREVSIPRNHPILTKIVEDLTGSNHG